MALSAQQVLLSLLKCNSSAISHWFIADLGKALMFERLVNRVYLFSTLFKASCKTLGVGLPRSLERGINCLSIKTPA